MNNFFKITLILIAIFLIGGGVVVYARNAGYIDIFLTPEEKIERELKKLEAKFPKQIEGYELYARGENKIRINEECNNLEDHPDTRKVGLTGEICGKTVEAEYRNQVTKDIVFIRTLNFTKGEEIYRAFLDKVTKSEKLGDLNVFRLEKHEIGWYPSVGFDLIMTQEGKYISNPDGSESMSYGSATGNNPVTKYFIKNFAPNN